MTTIDEQTDRQVYQVFIKATPEQIWDAITKPEFTERYFHGVRSDFDLRPGGHYRQTMGDDGSARDAGGGARGRPAEDASRTRGRPCTTPRWRWRSRAESRGRSKPQDGGTALLTVTHDQLEGAPKTAVGVYGTGWMGVPQRLKTLLETGKPLSVD